MKFKLHLVGLSVVSLLSVTHGCGKSVSGDSSVGGKSVGAEDITGGGAPATAAIDQLRKDLSEVDDELLKKIQAEEKARVEADKNLQSQITDLTKRLADLAASVAKDIEALRKEDENIKNNIIPGLEQKLTAEIANKTDDLRQEIVNLLKKYVTVEEFDKFKLDFEAYKVSITNELTAIKASIAANQRLSNTQLDVLEKAGIINATQKQQIKDNTLNINTVPNLAGKVDTIKAGLDTLSTDFTTFKNVDFRQLADRVARLEVIADVLYKAGIINAQQLVDLKAGNLDVNTVRNIGAQVDLLGVEVNNLKIDVKTLKDDFKGLDDRIKALEGLSATQLDVLVASGIITATQKDQIRAGTLDLKTVVNISLQVKGLLDNVQQLRNDVDLLMKQYVGIKADLDAQKALSDAQLTVLQNAGVLTAEQVANIKNGTVPADVPNIIGQINTRLTSLEKADKEFQAQQAAQDARILAQEQELAKFKDFANANFATKAELAAVQKAVSSLQQTINVLSGRVTDLESKLTPEFLARVDRLEVSVNEIKADVATLRQDFDDHIELYHTEFSTVTYSVAQAIADLRNQMNGRIDGVDAKVGALTDRVTELEKFIQAGGGLDQKLGALRADSQKMADQAYRDAVAYADAQTKELRGDMAADKQQVQDQIASILKELETVRQTAASAQALAKLNETKITTLEGKVTQAQKDIAGLKGQMDLLSGQVQNAFIKIGELSKGLITLGDDVKERFAQVNMRLAELEQAVGQSVTIIINIIFTNLEDMGLIQDLIAAITADNDKTVQAFYDFRIAQHRLEDAFIHAIDPVLSSKGVDARAMNASFGQIAIQAACNGFVGGVDDIASIKDKEWFFHLAREYARRLAAQVRNGTGWQDIFFGFPAIFVSDTNLKSLMVLGASESYASGSKPECQTMVSNWLKQNLVDMTPTGIAVRAALARDPEFLQAVRDLYVKSARMDAPIAALMNSIREAMRRQLGSWAAVDAKLIESVDGQPSIIAQLADYLLEQSVNAATLSEIRSNRERIIALEQDYAQLRGDSVKFAADLAALNKELTDFKAQINDQVKKLTGALQTSFSLIATIASRLGYTDLIAIATTATQTIGGTIQIYTPIPEDTCKGVEHFYNHISQTLTSKPSMRCTSLLTLSNKELTLQELTKCAIHGTYGSVAYSWGNTNLVNNGWDAMNQWNDGGQIVNNGLVFFRGEAPNSPENMRLRDLAPGQLWGAQAGRTALVFRVFGKFTDRIKFDVTRVIDQFAINKDPNADKYSVVVNAATFAKGTAWEVPLSDAIGSLNGCRTDRKVVITPIVKVNGVDQAAGTSCVHRFHTFSPIVLDLAGLGMVETTSPMLSSTLFDLDGNGRPERTGWLKKGAGLLALDLDGNGKIDNGRELFGQATRLADGKEARNGYLAMAQYDDNHDGMINSQDQIFASLRVWQDMNADGQSQSHELYSLQSVGVTAMATAYSDVPAASIIQDHGGRPEGNLIKYESRFFGPKHCGTDGCKTFDIYFGGTETFQTSQR